MDQTKQAPNYTRDGCFVSPEEDWIEEAEKAGGHQDEGGARYLRQTSRATNDRSQAGTEDTRVLLRAWPNDDAHDK